MICESKNITGGSRKALRLAAATLILGIAPVATGQDTTRYPDRPVRIVVPFPPGGAADTFARLAGQKLSERWTTRQQVVIDNRSGAGGIVGSEVAAKASADAATKSTLAI
jgi:tripartite-type tricarboxylate transporter receptor subunit TctC